MISNRLFSQATFQSLRRGQEYTLTVKTLVNGQPVGQITEKFNTNQLKNLQEKELTEDEDNINEEEEDTQAPEEVKEEDEGTHIVDIAEEEMRKR